MINKNFLIHDCLRVFEVKSRKGDEKWYVVAKDAEQVAYLLFKRGGEINLTHYKITPITDEHTFVEAIVGEVDQYDKLMKYHEFVEGL